jgi:hypothetical protein
MSAVMDVGLISAARHTQFPPPLRARKGGGNGESKLGHDEIAADGAGP